MKPVITEICKDFYQIDNVFELEFLSDLVQKFDHYKRWDQLTGTDENGVIRYQHGLNLNDQVSRGILEGLIPVTGFIIEQTQSRIWQNTPQLWADTPGYLNALHKDFSPNLSINVQVYLSDGNSNQGTWTQIDDEWYGINYCKNSGYIMFNPTNMVHGMRYPVIDRRMSLYQSFRTTSTASDIW